MIAYRISLAALESLIDAEKSNWRKRAKQRTAKFKQAGKYHETSSIWGEVKQVYMRLQGESKCIYCERKLESGLASGPEQDVEHYRPKGNVSAWPVPAALSHLAFTAAPGKGYHLLPYHLFNYAASCKPCNEVLKGDFFPIAGAYALAGEDPAQMKNEKPYLIYPFGDLDEDPETLIGFHGIAPQALAASGFQRDRALVTIHFFLLHDTAQRKNLMLERARIIITLFPFLKTLKGRASAADKTAAREIITGFTSPKAPHTNCARCFERLFLSQPQQARQVFDDARALIRSNS